MKIENRMVINRGAILLTILFMSMISLMVIFFAQRTFAIEAEAMPNRETAVTDTHSASSIHLNKISTYSGNGAEISAFDPNTNQLFVVAGGNFIDVIDMSEPVTPTQVMTIPLNTLGAGANSIAYNNGFIAIAVEANNKQENGIVGFYNVNGSFVVSVTVGALPDMLTFTPNGNKVVVANEGEPNDDYTVDPEGSISVIDISGGIPNLTQANVTHIGFSDFNEGQSRHDELDSDIRIFGPGASVAQDLEPEYIAVAADSNSAWVSLQENNGLAIIDLSDNSVTAIKSLGYKDHSIFPNELDPSDKDGGIFINKWPVKGMYQPDAIVSYQVGGQTYIISANEGDARDYAGFSEETRVEDVILDSGSFTITDTQTLTKEAALGRLKITNTKGQITSTNVYTELYAYGARSFSIWSAAGELVYDSGSDIERITASFSPASFNANNASASDFDERSDDKGAEPEGVTKAVINGRTYAFIGLERIGGIIIYDVSNPNSPKFIEYVQPDTGDVGPEGLLFIPAAESPNGKNLLVVTYEESNTVATYEIKAVPQLAYYSTYSGAAEIPAFDKDTERLFIVSGGDEINVVDVSNPFIPSQHMTISVASLGEGANSVAAHDGYIAAAIEANTKQDNGVVGFFDVEGNFVVSVTVGALPDMVTFTRDGNKVVVANEGEPNDDYTVDPEGSVSVIDISGGIANVTQANVTQIGFTDFNVGESRHGELDPAIRIFGPGASVAQDLEPEYVAISDDSSTAWVTLQENNGMAIINLNTNTVTSLVGYGTKDHTQYANLLDASNKDDGINIFNWPLKGMYQPDAIASINIEGNTYLLTANEGDARDYEGTPGFSEETRVKDVTLDSGIFSPVEAVFLQDEANLGRIKITETEGQIGATNVFTELYSFGGRSFSIWAGDGTQVYDSGSHFAGITAVSSPSTFNSEGAIDSFDDRSDDKGAEPEGITTGVVNGRTYAFVSLERVGGIVVYDVTEPTTPQFVQYQPPVDGATAPEGLLFIPATESPNGKNLLVVTYEVSGTTNIYTFGDDVGARFTYLPLVFKN